jgi:hypothetical protein
MNGVIAELWEKMTRPLNTNSTKIIGVSQHHLLFLEEPKKLACDIHPASQTPNKPYPCYLPGFILALH